MIIKALKVMIIFSGIRATDNTGLSNDFQLGITILMVNQAPVFNVSSGAASIWEGQAGTAILL